MNIKLPHPYTDIGNSKRWVEHFSNQFKLVPERDEWFYHDGNRWQVDEHGYRIQKTIDLFLQSLDADMDYLVSAIADLQQKLDVSSNKELKKLGSDDEDAALLGQLYDMLEENRHWYKACQSKGRIEACLALASMMGASKNYSEFDSKGKYLGVKNGVIHLATGAFTQNDPEYYITKSANADYDPDATCPNWLAFLDSTFKGDADLIAFIQRLAGEALLGERCKTKLIMLIGSGANGKSTLVDSLLLLMGNYAITTNPDAITAGTGNSNGYYLASMKGARLVLLNETNAHAKLDNKMVKQLVDSGPVQARQIYGKPFEFQPVATPILTTNNPPTISSEYAINRRLLCVNFNHQIPEADRNPNFIREKIQGELSGMLNWALEGCRQYLQQGGLNPPQVVLDSTREYIFEYDRVRKYVFELYDVDPNGRITDKQFYEDYVKWCHHFDYDVCGRKQFNQEIRAMGYDVKISTGNVFYVFGLSRKKSEGGNVVSIDTSKPKSALETCLEEALQF